MLRLYGTRALLFVVSLFALSTTYAQTGLVGRWQFNEGAGNQALDTSSLGNHGSISGAVYSVNGHGSSLLFDGINDQVTCGNDPSLSPSSGVTLRLWLYPEARIVGDHGVVVNGSIGSYGLTYFTDNRCWWYVAGGGNNVKAPVTFGHWTQVSCSYNGSEMRIYINGELKDSKALSVTIPPGAGNFTIGNRPSTGQRFRGFLDNVEVYNRGLTESEIQTLYQQEAALVLSNRPNVTSGPSVNGPGFSFRVGPGGGLQVDVDTDRYFLDTSFSYPASAIGLNYLSQDVFHSGAGWSPVAVQDGADAIRVTASGAYYSLTRTVTLETDRIKISDTLTNITAQDVGILASNAAIAQGGANDLLPVGLAPSVETPIALLVKANSSLGTVVEDDYGRLFFDRLDSSNQVTLGSRFFALKPGASYTFETALYPRSPARDYFGFIRDIRADWNADFRVPGPAGFMESTFSGILSPEAMANYFSQNQLKMIILSPWLDYDPGPLANVLTRQEYKDLMQPIIASLKQADPDILVLGAVETDWVSYDPDTIPNGDQLPVHGGGLTGNVELTPAQTAIIDAANLPWADSYKRTANGNLVVELYSRGGQPQQALSVYPEIGNYQHTFLMDQVTFLMDEVGMDGFYIDEFSQAWRSDVRTYNTRFNGTTWDGHSVDMDLVTGQILNRHTSPGVVGITSRLAIMDAAHSRGKVVIANTNATALPEHPVPANRFAETFSRIDPFSFTLGNMPALNNELLRGHLNTPIAFAVPGDTEQPDFTQRLIRSVIIYLRHGMIYYYGIFRNLTPVGGLGPVNNMFPITPAESGAGYVKGPERIVTTTSMVSDWPQGPRPEVLLYNEFGTPVAHSMQATPNGLDWTINVQLIDWRQIAIVRVDDSKPPPDFDRSGEVDQADLDHFLFCMTGPNAGPPVEGCGDADLDFDQDIDIEDYARLQGCFSGSLNPADPDCMN